MIIIAIIVFFIAGSFCLSHILGKIIKRYRILYGSRGSGKRPAILGKAVNPCNICGSIPLVKEGNYTLKKPWYRMICSCGNTAYGSSVLQIAIDEWNKVSYDNRFESDNNED